MTKPKKPQIGDGQDPDSFANAADAMGDVDRLPRRHRPPPDAKAPTRVAGNDGGGHPTALIHPDADEPLFGHRRGVSETTLRRLRAGKLRPEATIDLHGLRHDRARHRLGDAIEAAAREGLRCVLVIHGRGRRSAGGEAVLRGALPEWLDQPPLDRRVRAVAPAQRQDGGDGASYLLLA